MKIPKILENYEIVVQNLRNIFYPNFYSRFINNNYRIYLEIKILDKGVRVIFTTLFR